jgi:hypothetical protein
MPRPNPLKHRQPATPPSPNIDNWRALVLEAQREAARQSDAKEQYRAKIESQNEIIESLKHQLAERNAEIERHCEDREDDKKIIAGYQIAAMEALGAVNVYRITFRDWTKLAFGPGQDHADVMPSKHHSFGPQTVLAVTGLKAAERLRRNYAGPIEILDCEYICPLHVR